jgi:hypothetical protein
VVAEHVRLRSVESGAEVRVQGKALKQKGDRVAVGNQTGTITVGPAAPGETGRLTHQHPRYLQWAETGKYFLKGGADSPDNLLAYKDIDGSYRHSNSFRDGEVITKGLHHFTAYERDFVEGSPTWQNGKGKGILGGISYLASKGINSFYFLTMNIGGGVSSTPRRRRRRAAYQKYLYSN